MKIDINKDFEEAFPNEIYSGFTLGQCMAAVSGMILSFGAAFLLWRLAGIPIVECTYIAIPLMVPVCAIGFFRYQGQSLVGIIREFFYSRQTEKLAYGAGEYQRRSRKIFSAGRSPAVRPGKKRNRLRETKRKRRNKQMNKDKKEGAAYGSH